MYIRRRKLNRGKKAHCWCTLRGRGDVINCVRLGGPRIGFVFAHNHAPGRESVAGTLLDSAVPRFMFSHVPLYAHTKRALAPD